VQAIQVLRRAVEVASSSNEYHVALSNLGPALMRQFEVTGNAADLFEAIDLLRAAVESSSSGIERRKALSNLGAALMRQWEITGKSSSLLDSLQILGQAVEIKSNDSDLPAARYNYLLALLAAVNEGQDFPERQKLPEILARFEPDLIRVIESRFVRFGALHPATIEARINLASLYQAQADYPSARKELRSVLEDATEVLGAQHPTTITAATNLARALQSVGRASDAAEVLSTAHEASQKIYGLEDSHTLAIGSMLLCSFTLAVSSQGSSGSIDSRLTELGRGHPDAVFTMLLSSIGWDSWGDSAIPKTASKNYLVREYHPPHVTSMQVDDVLDVHIDLDRLADAIRVRLDQTPHRAICPPSEDGQQIPQFAAYAQNAIEKAFDGIDQRFSRMENAATLISKIVLIKTDDKVLMIPVEGTEVEFLESNQYLFQHPSSLLERIRSKRKLIVHRSRYEDGLASNSIP
jgi:tetratricopeptide (TPR) repeat protein